MLVLFAAAVLLASADLLGVAAVITATATFVGATSGAIVAFRRTGGPQSSSDEREVHDRLWFETLGRLESTQTRLDDLEEERRAWAEEKADLLARLAECQEARLKGLID